MEPWESCGGGQGFSVTVSGLLPLGSPPQLVFWNRLLHPSRHRLSTTVRSWAFKVLSLNYRIKSSWLCSESVVGRGACPAEEPLLCVPSWWVQGPHSCHPLLESLLMGSRLVDGAFAGDLWSGLAPGREAGAVSWRLVLAPHRMWPEGVCHRFKCTQASSTAAPQAV